MAAKTKEQVAAEVEAAVTGGLARTVDPAFVADNTARADAHRRRRVQLAPCAVGLSRQNQGSVTQYARLQDHDVVDLDAVGGARTKATLVKICMCRSYTPAGAAAGGSVCLWPHQLVM